MAIPGGTPASTSFARVNSRWEAERNRQLFSSQWMADCATRHRGAYLIAVWRFLVFTVPFPCFNCRDWNLPSHLASGKPGQKGK